MQYKSVFKKLFIAFSFLFAAPIWAAELEQVKEFGSNPGQLKMFQYIPDGLPSGAPLVVVLHGCTESASEYHLRGGWGKMADTYKFALVYPETNESNNPSSCFNWFVPGHQVRDKGEALSIKQMVDNMKSVHGSDEKRIYITGISAGGAMTGVMLASYPDVFAGGAIFAGVAYGCASDVMAGFSCANSGKSLTPEQWGDAVRKVNPDYKGPWPIVAIWHGMADWVVSPVNADQVRDQWTNVHGIGQKPTSVKKIRNANVFNYDKDKKTVVRVFKLEGLGHGQPVEPGKAPHQCGKLGPNYREFICAAYYTTTFWGLDAGAKKPVKSKPSAVPKKQL